MNHCLLKSYWLFYLIVKEGGFTKAANAAHMRQPPLSMHIKKLENELGVLLFKRNSKKVLLTKEGQAIFPCVEKFITDTEFFFEQIQSKLNDLEQKVTLGSFVWLL